MKKIKVLYVTPQCYPHMGGVEVHSHRVLKKLSTTYGKNIEILYLSADNKGRLQKKINNSLSLHVIKAIYLDGRSWAWINCQVRREILRIIKEFSPNIIHSHYRFSPITKYITKIANKKGIPHIFTIHVGNRNFSPKRLNNNIISFIDRTFVKTTFTKVNLLTAVSSSAARTLEQEWSLPENSVSVTKNFIDPTYILQFKKAKRNRITTPSLLFVGRLVHIKGYKEFFKLIGSQDESKKYSVTIIGHGPGNEDASQIANKYEHISFLGGQSNKEVLKNMATHNIQVNLSYSEGLATTIMEGMTMGQTIIATNIPQNKELLEHYPGAVFVHPNPSKKEWNIAIQKATLLCKQDYSKEGLQLTPTVEKTAKKYLALYRKFAKKQ